ncbi:MAG: glycosyltransferase [Anaerolineales bacterium]
MIAPEPVMAPRGTPISVAQRLHALSMLGHKVELLTYPMGEHIEIPNVTVHRSARVPGISDIKPGPSWRKAVLDVFLFAKAIGLLARNRYDAIHSHEEAAFFATLMAPLFGVKHIYDMHSSLPRQLLNFTYGRVRPVVGLFFILERWTLRHADAVITIDPDLAAYVRGISPETPHVMIENLPVQATAYGDTPARDVNGLRDRLGINGKLPVVYTGNFAGYQGLDLLVDAAELVRLENPKVVFVMVGGIPQRIKYWKEVVRSRGLENDFKFVGTVDVRDVPSYLELAEILVSPRTEGTSVPLKIYTYMHSGKPIVATRVLSHTQVLDDSMSMLPAPSKQEFASAIIRLAGEPILRSRLGRSAADLVASRSNPADYLQRVDRVVHLLNGSESHDAAPVGTPEKI